MGKILSTFLASLMLIGFLSVMGCANTFEGLGKDIEKIGKDIQK